MYLGYVGYKSLTAPPRRDSPEILALENELLAIPENDPLRQSKKRELDKLKQEHRQKEIDKYGKDRMVSIHEARDKIPEIIKRHNDAFERELQALQSGKELQNKSLFIPLWPVKQLPSEYYHGHHPEWQEFLKFSRNSQRQQRVKGNRPYQVSYIPVLKKFSI